MTAFDGRRLRAALFPQAGARGSVVINPGRTEPLEKYFELVDDLRARGFCVLVHDWRGQGLSDRLLKDRLRGHAEDADSFLKDFDALLTTFAARLPKPWIVLGHSMGGGLTALALARGEPRFAGAVLSAPMTGLNLGGRPVAQARSLATMATRLGLAATFVPGRSDPLGLPFALNILTHDEARWDRYARQIAACPDLRLGGATWGWVRFALNLSLELSRPGAAEGIRTPILAFLAGDELLVDNVATRAFVRRTPNGRLVEMPGSRHEILIELDPIRQRFFAEFDPWVLERLA